MMRVLQSAPRSPAGREPARDAGLVRRVLSFWRDRRGLAAAEFALCLPLLTLLYLGGFEACDAVATYRKLADTTATLANITAQYTTMSATDVQTVFNASAQVMAPAPTTNLKIVLSEITCDANANPKVVWSQAYNGATPLVANASVTLPTGMASANQSFILVQTSYQFLLPTGYAFSQALNMTSALYIQPRSSTSIPYTG